MIFNIGHFRRHLDWNYVVMSGQERLLWDVI